VAFAAPVRALEPNAVETDAAVQSGDFADCLARTTAWLNEKTLAAADETSLVALLTDPAFLAVLDQRQLIAKTGADKLAAFAKTGLVERIEKNINLIGLVGAPAPALDEAHWLGPKPATLAALHGHAVLLFFWAHWCPDCKAEAPVIERIARAYGRQGLVVIGPTRLYGYAARGEAATPAEETEYIDAVRRRFYAGLAEMAVPVSEAGFRAYGASTTPTLVLVDANGIVRYYHPGAVPEAELAARIDAVISR